MTVNHRRAIDLNINAMGGMGGGDIGIEVGGCWREGEEVWMHVAPTKDELGMWGLEGRTLDREVDVGKKEGEDESGEGYVQEDGMVEVSGNEGRGRVQHKGIEQRYMERG
ncbi:hypothetical protein B0J14DRAFT_657594 [Halenospora varia]|nr:hypothetical protein B0J14DRAFT_657594 [Halenospora varia]